MPSLGRHSITRRTLLRIGLAAGAGILAATFATYWIIFDAMEKTRLESLGQYVVERGRREEQRFLNAEAELEVLRERFVAEFEKAKPFVDDGWFEQRIALGEDGAYRSRRELVDPMREPNTWIRAGTEITDELRQLIRLSHDLCEQYFTIWQNHVSSLYVSSPLNFNSGIAPVLPDWVWDIAPDFNQSEFEWGRLGRTEFNPERRPLWTGVIIDVSAQDDAPKVGFVTVCQPVDFGERHLLTLHQDVFFNELLESVLSPDQPGVTHVVFRDDGRLIAHADHWDTLLEREGNYYLQDTPDSDLHSILSAVNDMEGKSGTGFDPATRLYFAATRLRGPDWWFVSLLPRSVVQQEASRSAQWILWIGLISASFVLIALAYILRVQIARPLGDFLAATKSLTAGQTQPSAAALEVRDDELGELAAAFNEMARKVTERDAILRAEKAGLEQRVSERTLELQEALEQARELARLKSNFISMVSHEYRTPLGIIVTSADILERYLDRLDPTERAEHVGAIQAAVKRMASMMEDVLLLGQLESELRHCRPDDLHLTAFCRRLIEEARAVHGERCPLQLDADADLPLARADESLLRHILTNLLSNAVKYSPAGSPVTLRLRREGEDAVIEVIDRGIGIPTEDQPNLFVTFHRGQNTSHLPGTGLGLDIVKRCVDLHGGRLDFQSREGLGTTFTVRLPIFPTDSDTTP